VTLLTINRANSWLLINVLERLRNGEHEALTVNALFNSEAVLHASRVKSELFWQISSDNQNTAVFMK
jgi:hypothetical protein